MTAQKKTNKKSSKVPAHSANALSRKTKDGSVYVLVLNNNKNYFYLEKLAAELWLAIDGKSDRDQLIQKLSKKHRVIESSVAPHVDRFLKQLKREKLLV